MPICRIETNLPISDVPGDLTVSFSKTVAEVLSKPEERISVTVNAGLQMCRGGCTDLTAVIHIWSIGVFSKEKNPGYSDKLFDFLKSKLPTISEKRIVLVFHPIEAHDPQIRP